MSDPSTNGHGLELENLGSGGATPGSTSPRMLVPLFVVPLLIVGVIVGIFLLVGSFVGTEKSIEEWIAEVQTGGVNERWQAAAGLSDIAVKSPEKMATPDVRRRLRELFAVAGPEDSRIRQWVAEIWGTIGDADAVSLVLEGVERMNQELNAPGGREGPHAEPAAKELTSYLRTMGRIGNSSCEAAVAAVAKDSDLGLRMAAAEALGFLGRKTISAGGAASDRVVNALIALHGDADPWVRMNAALSLAKCRRFEGLPTLEAMIDRTWLRSQNLRFPDDGKYSVNDTDPAVAPIGSALVAIDELLGSAAVEGPDRGALSDALMKAAADQNPQIQARAREVLKKVGG